LPEIAWQIQSDSISFENIFKDGGALPSETEKHKPFVCPKPCYGSLTNDNNLCILIIAAIKSIKISDLEENK
jgi:hypothetical protein